MRDDKPVQNVESIWGWIKWVAMFVAAWFKTLPTLTQSLLLLMLLDLLAGVAVAIKNKDLSPNTLWLGLGKKLLTLIIVSAAGIVSPHVQDILGINLLMAASAFYCAAELLSIVKNASQFNVEQFSQLSGVAEYFRNIGDKKKPDA